MLGVTLGPLMGLPLRGLEGWEAVGGDAVPWVGLRAAGNKRTRVIRKKKPHPQEYQKPSPAASTG